MPKDVPEEIGLQPLWPLLAAAKAAFMAVWFGTAEAVP
jgi:hypothetical protein